MSRRKVLIAISNGWALRNFLHTNLINKFAEEYDVSIVTSTHMVDYFWGLKKEGVISSVRDLSEDENYLWRRLRQFKKILLLSSYQSSTLIVKNKYWIPAEWLVPLADCIWKLIRHLPILTIVSFIERCEKKFRTRDLDHWEKTIDLFISGEPCDPREMQLLRCFDKANIPTTSIVQSWDNPSSKGHNFSSSARILVWGRAMKDEVERLYPKLDSKKIIPVGLTQFDQYFENKNIGDVARHSFLEGLGIAADRHVILFATNAPRHSPDDLEMIELLAKECEAQLSDLNCHLLVRLHQADEVSRYSAISDHPRVTICASSLPDRQTLDTWIPPTEELEKLSNFLFFSDVCLNTASTMTLDAMAVGLPVLNIGFNIEKTSARKSKARLYKYHHWKPLLEANILKICRSRQELINGIRQAIIKKPDDANEITIALEHLCNTGKGLAIDNIFNAIEDQLNN